jgi:hypothetical protein
MHKILRRIDWQTREQVERRIDQEIRAVHKDERRVRRESTDNGIDG